MAKGFPYFKFKPTEWLTGDIVFESFAVQGLFINICALYWQRDGVVTLDDLIKRYKHPIELDSLIDRFIMVDDKNITIQFLDEQLHEAGHISAKNSAKGKLGGRPPGASIKEKKPAAFTKKPVQADESRKNPIKTKGNNNKIKGNAEVKLRGQCKEMFLSFYKEKFQTDFYWTAKDANNLIGLVKKISFKVKEKFPQKENINDDVLAGMNHLLLQIKDSWVLANFSIPIINSKFNEIFIQIKSGNHGKQQSTATNATERNQEVANLGKLAAAIVENAINPKD